MALGSAAGPTRVTARPFGSTDDGSADPSVWAEARFQRVLSQLKLWWWLYISVSVAQRSTKKKKISRLGASGGSGETQKDNWFLD